MSISRADDKVQIRHSVHPRHQMLTMKKNVAGVFSNDSLCIKVGRRVGIPSPFYRIISDFSPVPIRVRRAKPMKRQEVITSFLRVSPEIVTMSSSFQYRLHVSDYALVNVFSLFLHFLLSLFYFLQTVCWFLDRIMSSQSIMA